MKDQSEKIKRTQPIFAEKDGQLVGMLVHEFLPEEQDYMWVLRIGGHLSASGYWKERRDLVADATLWGYRFFVRD